MAGPACFAQETVEAVVGQGEQAQDPLGGRVALGLDVARQEEGQVGDAVGARRLRDAGDPGRELAAGEVPALAEPLEMRELLFRLDELDRRVLELRLGFADDEAKTYVETARILGISVTRARRIEARALEKLRAFCPQQASARL